MQSGASKRKSDRCTCQVTSELSRVEVTSSASTPYILIVAPRILSPMEEDYRVRASVLSPLKKTSTSQIWTFRVSLLIVLCGASLALAISVRGVSTRASRLYSGLGQRGWHWANPSNARAAFRKHGDVHALSVLA